MRLWIATLFLITTATYAAKSVDAPGFFKGIEGKYEIELAGGEPPHSQNALADVFADMDEAVITLPYCPPGEGCLPGYLFFPYDKTEISEEALADGTGKFALVVTDGDKRTYEWREKSGKITFSNPQFELDGKVSELQHVIKKR